MGRGTVVRVTNNHATAAAYLTLLRIIANRAYEAPDPTSYRAENGASQTTHGLRAAPVDCRFIDHYEAAKVAADARLSHRSWPHTQLTLTIPAGSNYNLAQVVHRVLSDRVRVVSDNPVVDSDFFVEGMELKAIARTGELTCRWLLEEV